MRWRRSTLHLKGASMAKRKTTISAGRLRKVVLYTAPEPRDGQRARAEKSRATSAAHKAMNDKAARSRLEMLIAANFSGRDLFLTLTYRDNDLPANRAAAVKNVRSFLAKLRTVRRRRGRVFRYIYTTEEKHGEARLHHHLIITGTGNDMEEIRSLWPHGDMIEFEYVGARGGDVLSEYMTKESVQGKPVGAQMWTCSKGLIKPVVKSEIVASNTALVAPSGCRVIEKDEKQTEFGSYQYIKYRVPEYCREENGTE